MVIQELIDALKRNKRHLAVFAIFGSIAYINNLIGGFLLGFYSAALTIANKDRLKQYDLLNVQGVGNNGNKGKNDKKKPA